MTPEGRVKAAIKRALKRHGVWYTMPVPHSAYGSMSVDFLCCVRGRFLAIEAKAPGRQLTARQQACLAAIEAAGGLTAVIDDAAAAEAVIAEVVRRLEGEGA